MKTVRIIPLVLLVFILLSGCANTSRVNITTEIDNAVSNAILTHNKDSFYEGECQAEGMWFLMPKKQMTES